MVDKKKLTIGALLLTLFASGAIIAIFPLFGVLMDCDHDNCRFKVKEGSYWKLAGIETNELREGTTKLNRKASLITISNDFVEGATNGTFIRETPYKNGILIRDTIHFEGDINKVDLFPFYHKVEIYNASGLSYDWFVDEIVYDGPTAAFKPYQTKVSFGLNMTATWQEGFHFAKIYKSGSLRVRYKIKSDYEVINVRLFDPPVVNWTVFRPCYNTTKGIKEVIYNYTRQINETVSENGTDSSWSDNYTVKKREEYTIENTDCVERGVIYNNTLFLHDQSDRKAKRTKNIYCQWLLHDAVNINSRGPNRINSTAKDNSEDGICVDLNNELVIVSNSGGIYLK